LGIGLAEKESIPTPGVHCRTRSRLSCRRSSTVPGCRGCQYGIRRCSFGSATTVGTDPPLLPHTFDNGDVEGLIQSRIDAGQFPEPDEPGGRNLYVVFMPPNTKHPDVDGITVGGLHSSFVTGSVIDADRAWYALVCTNSSFDEMVRVFSHEVAEACTDPEDDGWKVYDSSTGTDEIGDICNSRTGTVSAVNNVEAYWSMHEGTCILPTTWSLRRQWDRLARLALTSAFVAEQSCDAGTARPLVCRQCTPQLDGRGMPKDVMSRLT